MYICQHIDLVRIYHMLARCDCFKNRYKSCDIVQFIQTCISTHTHEHTTEIVRIYDIFSNELVPKTITKIGNHSIHVDKHEDTHAKHRRAESVRIHTNTCMHTCIECIHMCDHPSEKDRLRPTEEIRQNCEAKTRAHELNIAAYIYMK